MPDLAGNIAQLTSVLTDGSRLVHIYNAQLGWLSMHKNRLRHWVKFCVVAIWVVWAYENLHNIHRYLFTYHYCDYYLLRKTETVIVNVVGSFLSDRCWPLVISQESLYTTSPADAPDIVVHVVSHNCYCLLSRHIFMHHT